MRIRLHPAAVDDVDGLVALRSRVSEHLAMQFPGLYFPSGMTGKGIRFAMSRASIFVARFRGDIIATLALSTRKPWAIDSGSFTSTDCPLYLTDMAVDPRRQRKGLGRQCLHQAVELARKWPATALRLDAYDAQYGAGGFYQKCGFREVAHAVYRRTPLLYFEFLLAPGG